MLVRIRHVTSYVYEGGARYSIQALRLTPPDFDTQRIIEWRITAPGLDCSQSFRDGFGNAVCLAAIAGSHDASTVAAEGLVETADSAGVLRGLPEPVPLRVFLRETAKSRPDAAIRDLAASSQGTDRLARLHDLMRQVRKSVSYEIGATHAHTSAAEALAEGRGVCQDHAHIFIAAARSLGIPARYVNGYFLSGGAGVSEAHHAWAEAWVDGLGWVGFDTANLVCPTSSYVRLNSGLDAGYTAPIRGLRRGGEAETLDVAVEVEQQGSQQ